MSLKQNCWEFKDCGRESGGINSQELGVCPSASDESADGLNKGKNGGRICWSIAGTLCGGKVQGTFADKLGSCQRCEFMKKVQEEEGMDFKLFKLNVSY